MTAVPQDGYELLDAMCGLEVSPDRRCMPLERTRSTTNITPEK